MSNRPEFRAHHREYVRLFRLPVLATVFASALATVACSATSRSPASSTTDGGVTGDPSGIMPSTTDDAAVGDGGCTQNVDIVFVMDVSTSMDSFLNKLGDEIVAVDTSIQSISPTASPYYGLAVFVDDAQLLNGGAPFQNVNALAGEFKKWANFSKGNTELSGAGDNNTWTENSLDAIYDAASGFAWRPGSLRIIIHTTDDTFWNGPTTGNGVTIQHSYQDTVKMLQDQQIRFYSFASKLGGESGHADVSMGWFGPYGGQDAIPKATFGTVSLLDQINSGQVSLSDSIEGLVRDTFCKPYPAIH